ncbi:hypothetical protein B0H16DRAFT_1728039 [Mycena metata]|uniref:Uncharacterized protein n=1 Tax=Mycena metata TaxID=1033252 RepID=A0AAD7N2H4_9AGAR|nr:hypothetical protein B0H16DRAFT_1728039 [Mycena metata]
MVPNLVKVVVVNDWHAFECWKDRARCLQTPPTGIPAHKMFSFYFWPFANHPLGPRWVLSPEPYALEPGSNRLLNRARLRPHAFRPYRLTPKASLAPCETPLLPLRRKRTRVVNGRLRRRGEGKRRAIRAGGGAGGLRDGGAGGEGFAAPRGVREPRAVGEGSVYAATGAESGVGWDWEPSHLTDAVGRALLWVPFINPLDRWDDDNPEDSTKWHGQHAFLSMLGKPYVYNVRQGDRAGFVQAIQEALANPIDRCVT